MQTLRARVSIYLYLALPGPAEPIASYPILMCVCVCVQCTDPFKGASMHRSIPELAHE